MPTSASGNGQKYQGRNDSSEPGDRDALEVRRKGSVCSEELDRAPTPAMTTATVDTAKIARARACTASVIGQSAGGHDGRASGITHGRGPRRTATPLLLRLLVDPLRFAVSRADNPHGDRLDHAPTGRRPVARSRGCSECPDSDLGSLACRAAANMGRCDWPGRRCLLPRTGVVAVVGARRMTPPPSLGRLGLAFGALTSVATVVVFSVLQPGTPAPLWTISLVTVSAIPFGGLATVAAYSFLPRVRLGDGKWGENGSVVQINMPRLRRGEAAPPVIGAGVEVAPGSHGSGKRGYSRWHGTLANPLG